MAGINKEKKLKASILDRLIDDEPHINREVNQAFHQRISEMRKSVKRDLENLLNTRFRVIEPPEEFSQLEDSLLNYGLPDLATLNITDNEKRKEFTRHLEDTIRRYEPRFKSVSVSYQENKDNTDRTLRFRIDAILYADPSPEVIVFDSVLEPVSRNVNIEESPHG